MQAGFDQEVELRDLFPETFGALNEVVRRAYLALIDRWPRSWRHVYDWLDRINNFDERFQKFRHLKRNLGRQLDRFQPDVAVSTFPPYPYLLHQILENDQRCKNVAVVTDSITVNAIWYRSPADYFLVANERSAAIVRRGGVSAEKIKVFGFPVSPRFADFSRNRDLFPRRKLRVLYIVNAGSGRAPNLVRKLLELDLELTVTVGRNEKLRRAIEKVAAWDTAVHPQLLVGESRALGRRRVVAMVRAHAECSSSTARQAWSMAESV